MNSRWITLGLSLAGVAGVGVTSWLSIKSHDKARDKQTKKEKFIAYIPAITSGVLTSACILGSHRISRKEIIALTASCAYLTTNKEKLEKIVKEKFGPEKLAEVKKEVSRQMIKERKPGTVKIETTGYGNVHFVESVLGREFYCSEAHVKWSFKTLNAMFQHGDNVNMNTLYELWGLKKTKDGYEWGWPEDDDCFGYSPDEPIHPEIVKGLDENGKLMYWIDILTRPPIKDYMEAENSLREEGVIL